MSMAAVAMFWRSRENRCFPFTLLNLFMDASCPHPCAFGVEVLWAGASVSMPFVALLGLSCLGPLQAFLVVRRLLSEGARDLVLVLLPASVAAAPFSEWCNMLHSRVG
jgi:hypothetical protein